MRLDMAQHQAANHLEDNLDSQPNSPQAMQLTDEDADSEFANSNVLSPVSAISYTEREQQSNTVDSDSDYQPIFG